MSSDTSLENFYALLLESANESCKFAKNIFFGKNSKNVYEKQNVQKMIKYTFLKALDHAFSNVQKTLTTF